MRAGGTGLLAKLARQACGGNPAHANKEGAAAAHHHHARPLEGGTTTTTAYSVQSRHYMYGVVIAALGGTLAVSHQEDYQDCGVV